MNHIIEFLQNIFGITVLPKTAETIYTLCKSEKLDDDQTLMIATLLGDIITGFLKEPGLSKEIENSLSISRGSADNLAIKLGDILISIKANAVQTLQIEEGVPLKPAFAKEPPIISQGTKPITETPKPQPISDYQPAHEAPFILHKEEEIEPAKELTQERYSTQRPAFYKPTFSEEYRKSALRESAAKVELGEEEKREPEIKRTPTQQTRIVHYSEFRTPLDPFGAAEGEPQTTEPAKKESDKNQRPPEVHPNNVVDLKDLPLK